MHTKEELEQTIKLCDTKEKEILTNGKGSDVDYIQNLQTLAKLRAAAENKLKE
jgi:hypothetical protein